MIDFKDSAIIKINPDSFGGGRAAQLLDRQGWTVSALLSYEATFSFNACRSVGGVLVYRTLYVSYGGSRKFDWAVSELKNGKSEIVTKGTGESLDDAFNAVSAAADDHEMRLRSVA